MTTPPDDQFDREWLQRYRAASRAELPGTGPQVHAAVQLEAHRLAAAPTLARRWPAWGALAAALVAVAWLLPPWRTPARSDASTSPALGAAAPATAASAPAPASAAQPAVPTSPMPTAAAVTRQRPALQAPVATEFAAARATPSAERATPSAERATPSAERATPSAERAAASVDAAAAPAAAASSTATSGSIDARDGKGRTALMRAAMDGNAAQVARLLRAGADASLTDAHGERALDLARRQQHARVIELLQSVDAGRAVSPPSR